MTLLMTRCGHNALLSAAGCVSVPSCACSVNSSYSISASSMRGCVLPLSARSETAALSTPETCVHFPPTHCSPLPQCCCPAARHHPRPRHGGQPVPGQPGHGRHPERHPVVRGVPQSGAAHAQQHRGALITLFRRHRACLPCCLLYFVRRPAHLCLHLALPALAAMSEWRDKATNHPCLADKYTRRALGLHRTASTSAQHSWTSCPSTWQRTSWTCRRSRCR